MCYHFIRERNQKTFTMVSLSITRKRTPFSGTIRKQLQSCEKLPIINFSKIESALSVIDSNILSTDQKYYTFVLLWRAEWRTAQTKSWKDGSFSVTLPLIGFLRLYVATEIPSQNLMTLATFVATVYTPM